MKIIRTNARMVGPLLLLSAGGCMATIHPGGEKAEAPAAACNAGRIGAAVGHVLDDAMGEKLRQDAGARTIRVIHPGQPVTMDYRQDRLNVEVDADGRIIRVNCG